MVGIITLLVSLVISLLVTRIGSVAFTLTGMSKEAARFQARSAYTGVGYTTAESEQVVNHPVRRRIAGLLMVCGNVGIAVVIASMMASLTAGSGGGLVRVVFLIIGVIVVGVIGTRAWVDQTVERSIEWALLKWTHLDVRDYVSLLHLVDGYVVLELLVNEQDWVANKPLSETRLSSEGVLVLGLHRANGSYIGSPNGNTVIKIDDTLTVYGPIERLEELDLRQQGFDGDRAHKIAIANQEEVAKQQDVSDPGSESE